MQRLRRIQRLLVISVLLLITTQVIVGCEYVARFIIHIDEGRNYPCIGVYRFTFVIEALEEGQELLTSERVTETFGNTELFWNSAGNCQIPQGLLLKNIPYGGTRKITIQAYDSSGLPVSSGTSPSFVLEPRGSEVQSNIKMDLVRGCHKFDALTGDCINRKTVSIGTLVINVPINYPIPGGTRRLHFQIPAVGNSPEINRTILIENSDKPPPTIILTDIPPASRRIYTLNAINIKDQIIRQWGGEYSMPEQINASNATHHINASVQ